MSEDELADIEARLSDGEPYIALAERPYIADIRRLLRLVRRCRVVLRQARWQHLGSCGGAGACICGADMMNARIDALLEHSAR